MAGLLELVTQSLDGDAGASRATDGSGFLGQVPGGLGDLSGKR